jgi:hypothetical protein
MAKRYNRFNFFIPLMLVVFAFTAVPERADAQEQEKFRNVYRARIVDASNRQSGLAGTAEFIVTRWTNSAEREVLLNTLSEKGHDEFIKALRLREETGFFRPQTTQSSSYPSTRFRYAYQFDKEDGGKHIVIVTDRTIRMGERGDSVNYDVTLIQMDFPANSDEGTGTMYWALKVDWDKENDRLKMTRGDGSEGLRLTQVKLVK